MVGSFILASIFLLSVYYINTQCKTRVVICSDFTEYLWMYTFIFVPVFVLSFVAYFLQEKTFSAWEKFTSWWIALTFLLILVTPESGFRGVGGLGPITLLAFFTKELAVWFSVIGYSAFSTILIAYKFFQLKKSGAGE